MATTPNNIQEQVQTYAESKVGALSNQNCFLGSFNKEFDEFEDSPKNLGDTINIELPNRAIVNNGLLAKFTGVQQLLQPLTCDQAANSANAFNTGQFIFNADQYMNKYGMARVNELGAAVESNVALNANSSVPVNTVNDNGETVPSGALHTESGPFLYYGNGIASIDTFQQLAQLEAFQKDFGVPSDGKETNIYLPLMAVTDIIGNGLDQFVLSRNEELANNNSWELGKYKGSSSNFYQSNLLPIQTAGTLGEEGVELVLVSTNDPAGNAITQLTFSNAGSADSAAIKAGDVGRFLDNVSGADNIRYLTYVGHKPSQNPVQIRVTANSASSGGNVTVSIYPALKSTPGLQQNLSRPLQAGMKVKFVPSHRCGMLVTGNAGFLAMPEMPDMSPYVSHVAVDKDTKLSVRDYYGNGFGNNQRGYVTDIMWTSTVVPWYSRRIIFPLTQSQFM